MMASLLKIWVMFNLTGASRAPWTGGHTPPAVSHLSFAHEDNDDDIDKYKEATHLKTYMKK